MKRVGSNRNKPVVTDDGKSKDCPKLEAKKYIELDEDKDGFEVRFIDKYIGKGVFSTQQFRKGDFLMSYTGELVSNEEILRRERMYPLKLGSFLYFITWKGKKYGVDATFSDRICRFVNDGVGRQRNCVMVLETFSDQPHLCLYASRDIAIGEEIRYDYGVHNLPWRCKNSSQSKGAYPKKQCEDDRKSADHEVTSCSVVVEKLNLQSIRKLGYNTMFINASTELTEASCHKQSPDNTAVQPDNTAVQPDNTPVQPSDNTPVQPSDNTAVQPSDNTAVQPSDNTPVQPSDNTAVQPSDNTPVQPSDNTAVQPDNTAVQLSDNTPVQPSDNTAVQPDNTAVQLSDNTPVQPSDNTAVQPDNTAVQPSDNTAVQPSDNTAVQPDNTAVQPSDNTAVQLSDNTAVQLSDNTPVQSSDNTAVQPSDNTAVQPSDNTAVQPDNTAVQPSDNTAVQPSDNTAVQPSDNTAVQPSDNTTVQPDNTAVQPDNVAVQLSDNTTIQHDNTESTEVICFEPSSSNTAGQSGSKKCNKDLKCKTSSSQESSQSKKKPYRPCLYCSKPQSKLVVHLKRKHCDEDRVKAAMLLPNALRSREFDKIRKDGIFAANRKILLDKDLTNDEKKKKLLIERRQGKKDISICSLCNGFFATNTVYKHKRSCPGAEVTTAAPVALPVSTIGEVNDSTDFRDKILRKFRRDNVGEICRTDTFIKLLGQHNFRKVTTRVEKKDELTETIMRDMRRFASLYVEFKSSAEKNQKQITSSVDVLKREHFKYLQEAIVNMTTKDDGTIKSGLKTGLGYLLKKATKVLKGHYLLEQQDEKAEEVDKFSTLLSYFWISMFSDAEYANVKARQTDLRRPKHLPVEEDIKKLRTYIMKEIENYLDPHSFFTRTEFKSLRDMLVCRLTLFNARRGGEPSRLLLKEWEDAEKGEWISESAIQSVNDPLEQQLIGKFKIAFQSGKNLNQMVPLLIPNDCLEGLRKLADVATRKVAGVDEANMFLFPNTSSSEKHIKGWHAVNSVCTRAGISKTINATSMRHRASTIFAGLDIPESERQLFYQHMGHSEEMNKNVYQCPLAVQEVTKVGRFLSNLDTNGSMATAGPSEEPVSVLAEVVDASKRKGIQKRRLPKGAKQSDLAEVVDVSKRKGIQKRRLPKGAKQSDLVLKDQGSDDGDDSANDLDYKPTGSDTDADDTAESSEEEEDPEICIKTTSVPKRGQRHIWTPESTRTVRTYFSSCVDDTSTFDRMGSLPGKEVVNAFLKKHPEILCGLSEKKRVLLMRTKLYNERNKSRNRVRKSLTGMWK